MKWTFCLREDWLPLECVASRLCCQGFKCCAVDPVKIGVGVEHMVLLLLLWSQVWAWAQEGKGDEAGRVGWPGLRGQSEAKHGSPAV